MVEYWGSPVPLAPDSLPLRSTVLGVRLQILLQVWCLSALDAHISSQGAPRLLPEADFELVSSKSLGS